MPIIPGCLTAHRWTKISHGNTFRRPHNAQVIESELDVTLVSRSIVGETKWWLYTDPMGSDHIPGLIELTGRRVHAPVYKGDWGRYRLIADNLMKPEETVSQPVQGRDMGEEVQRFVAHVHTAEKGARTETTPHKTEHLAYWSVACQKVTNARKIAYRKWERTRTEESYVIYKREKAKCRKFLRQQRRKSFEKLSQGLNERCNLRLAWSLVHGVDGMGKVTCINSSQLLTELGNKRALKAAHEHFTQLYTSRSGRQAKDCEIILGGREECRNFGDPFTMAELLRALGSRPNTSPGTDGITYNLLKSLPMAGKIALLGVFKRELGTGQGTKTVERGKDYFVA